MFKPMPMASAILKVNGIAMAVMTAGATSVKSSHSKSASPCTIKQATKINAGAVAKAGMDVASGAKNKAARNKIPVVTAVRPVRPPALMPAMLSM